MWSGYPVFYDAYGLPVWAPPGQGVLLQNLATAQPFQYKGQYGCYTDGASGLIYCSQRYYDPLSGRWASRDPSGLDGGVNVYAYVDGNPVTGADPSGLDGDSWFDWRQFGRDVWGVYNGYGHALLGIVKSPYTLAQTLGTWAGNDWSLDYGKKMVSSAWAGFYGGITGELGADAFGETLGSVLLTAATGGEDAVEVGAEEITAGAYLYPAEELDKLYIGQSGYIPGRIGQWARKIKFDPKLVERFEETRGKEAREVLEQRLIDEYGGIKGGRLLNKRNPIGKARQHLKKKYKDPRN